MPFFAESRKQSVTPTTAFGCILIAAVKVSVARLIEGSDGRPTRINQKPLHASTVRPSLVRKNDDPVSLSGGGIVMAMNTCWSMLLKILSGKMIINGILSPAVSQQTPL